MARVRLGTVGYLNSRPLTDHLDPTRYEVRADHPRGIAAALADGAVDVALAPVAAVLSDPALRVLPGWCIGADGPVQSVLLAAETPPEAWTEVVLDGESRTSVVLAQLLLRDGPLAARVRADLSVRTVAPGAGPALARGGVAAVVIGDPARALPERLTVRLDLAALWKEWTGKPFVFAVWACRDGLPTAVQDDLREAGRRGVAAIPEHATGADLDYLTRAIRYPLDEAALIGLRRFAALAHRAGFTATPHVALASPDPATRPVASADADALLAASEGARVPVSHARAWLARFPTAELLAAADLRRAALHGRERATWLPCETIDARTVSAGGPAFEARLTQAADAGATAVALAGVAGLESEAACARLRAAIDHGLQPAGATDLELAAAAQRARIAPVVRLAVLASAGLAALDVRPGVDATVLQEARRLGVTVTAHLDAGLDDDALVDAWDALRRAHERTGALSAVAVHLALPAGALVAPGRPTTARHARALAVTRLWLDAVPHVLTSPGTVGLAATEVSLLGGADDTGPAPSSGATHADAASFDVSIEALERVLRTAGFEPLRRDLAFREVGGALTPLRRVRRPEERA